MDGFVGSAAEMLQSTQPVASAPSLPLSPSLPSRDWELKWLPGVSAVVLTKHSAGFDRSMIDAAGEALATAVEARGLKFVVFDFAHQGTASDPPAEGFDDLLSQVSALILRAPVVTVAVARHQMCGANLELALACNLLVSAPWARFSFDADPLLSVRTYALLAQKIGFVRAERLMEGGEVLGPEELHALMLLKETLTSDGQVDGLTTFLTRYLRRHNAACGIYKAQRIASPFPLDRLIASGRPS